MGKASLQNIEVVLCKKKKKTARKRSLYSKNETIVKQIGYKNCRLWEQSSDQQRTR